MTSRLVRLIRKHSPSPLNWYLSKDYLIAGRYRRIYHFHIRKTAGTSLDASFWKLADLTFHDVGRKAQVRKGKFIIVRGNRQIIELGNYFYASSHWPAHAIQLPKQTFTITILRDPLSRLLSYYRYLLWAREDPLAKIQEPFFEELTPEIECTANGFQAFLDKAQSKDLLNQLYMFSEAFEVGEALSRIRSVSSVGFTETFDQSIEQLSARLDLPLAPAHERRFKYEFCPSRVELARARELLDPEFRFVEEVRKRTIGQLA